MTTIGVFAMVFNENEKLLCVRMNYAEKKWTTPGGRVEPGENPSEALEREVREETGFNVSVGDLIGVYAKPFEDDVVLSFEAKVLSQEEWEPNDEITELHWFSSNEIPRDMTRVVRSRIQDAFAGRRGVYRVFNKDDSRAT